MVLTESEREVLHAIRYSQFQSDPDAPDWTWSDCLIDDCPTVKGKVLSAIVSNLVQKGLVLTDGHTGRDACVKLSANGLDISRQIEGE